MNNDNLPEGMWDTLEKRMLTLIEKHSRPASEIILDDVDLRNLLKVSRRTCLKYRTEGIFQFYKLLDGKIYYFLSDIIEGIKQKGGTNGN
jgi:hypothetical protein